MHRPSATLLIMIVSFPLAAGAQSAPPNAEPTFDIAPAQRYAHGSFSLGGGAGSLFISTPAGRATQFGADALARWVSTVGFEITATLGGGAAFGQTSMGAVPQSDSIVMFGGSLAAGWAFALGTHLAITPEMYIGEDGMFATGTPGASTSLAHGPVVGARFPIEVFVSRHVAIEPGLFAEADLQQPGIFVFGSGVAVLFTL